MRRSWNVIREVVERTFKGTVVMLVIVVAMLLLAGAVGFVFVGLLNYPWAVLPMIFLLLGYFVGKDL